MRLSIQEKMLREVTSRSLSYREDKERGVIIEIFEGFEFCEAPIVLFKDAKDFRDYPKIFQRLMDTGGGKFPKLAYED